MCGVMGGGASICVGRCDGGGRESQAMSVQVTHSDGAMAGRNAIHSRSSSNHDSRMHHGHLVLMVVVG